MGTQDTFRFNTHVNLVNKGSINEVLYKKMLLFLDFLWFSITTYMFYLFKIITRCFFRFQGGNSSEKDDLKISTVLPQEDNQIASNCFEPELEPEIKPEVSNSDEISEDDGGFEKEETPKFFFKFQFQTFEGTHQGNGESENSVSPEILPSTSTTTNNKYQFLSGKDFSGFVEEQEFMTFTVKEFYVDDSNNDSLINEEIPHGGFFYEKDFLQPNSEAESVSSEEEPERTEAVTLTEEQFSEKEPNSETEAVSREEEPERTESITLTEEQFSEKEPNSETEAVSREEEPEKTEAVTFTEEQFSEKEPNSETEAVSREEEPERAEDVAFTEDQLVGSGNEHISDELQLLSDKDLFDLDLHSESISLRNGFSIKNHLIDSNSAEFLSERDFGGFETEALKDFYGEEVVLTEETQSSDETHLQNSSTLDAEAIDISNRSCSSSSSSVQKPLGNEPKDFDGEDTEPVNGVENFEGRYAESEPNLENSWASESEDSNILETLWEHQDLIEQLKMELKKVRATGLPTILEESESPRVIEDLKPWKIDEKFQHEDRRDELQKFYKSYRERMRKFDILNYQKMYALGFLQLKDPLQSISGKKASPLTIMSILSQNLWPNKCQQPQVDPTMKFVRELQVDLEMVYVGQVCLSWEFLHWQYGKVQELEESDPHGFRQYNQVAGEFQQFQVLLQRFMENEPFQGPRVQNYIKNRCVLRNLLQVPVIKEDSFKGKLKGRRSDDDAITSAMLTEITQEAIRIFWQFLRADSDAISRSLSKSQVELQDPADSKLLVDIRANLQKKEKRLKEIFKSGNCIVKKLQKHREHRSEVFFFSQVDMKLVSRVLNMSRITSEQLVWCHQKLDNIAFIDRKVQREPSFLLFPCSNC